MFKEGCYFFHVLNYVEVGIDELNSFDEVGRA